MSEKLEEKTRQSSIFKKGNEVRTRKANQELEDAQKENPEVKGRKKKERNTWEDVQSNPDNSKPKGKLPSDKRKHANKLKMEETDMGTENKEQLDELSIADKKESVRGKGKKPSKNERLELSKKLADVKLPKGGTALQKLEADKQTIQLTAKSKEDHDKKMKVIDAKIAELKSGTDAKKKAKDAVKESLEMFIQNIARDDYSNTDSMLQDIVQHKIGQKTDEEVERIRSES